MAQAEFGKRVGEAAIVLPERTDAGVYFIGRIATPLSRREDCPKNSRGSEAVCTVVRDPRYARGLEGLGGTSHLVLLYWMDRAPRDLILQTPRHRPEATGVFALRSPARPNPIALSVVELLAIEGPRLTVRGLDCLDGTPLIDIKPYFASTDSRPEAVVGWREGA